MNTETGHIVNPKTDEEAQALAKKGYEVIPEKLRGAVKKKLGGKKEAVVDLKSTSTLAKWAAKRRREKKTYANYLANKRLRRKLRKDGYTGLVKIANGKVVQKEEA